MLEKTLESPLDYRDIKPVNPTQEINPEYTLEGLMLKLKLYYFGYLMWRAYSLEKTLMLEKIWGQEEKGVIENEMVGWHRWHSGHEFERALGDGEGQGSLVGCSPWGHNESNLLGTEQQHIEIQFILLYSHYNFHE